MSKMKHYASPCILREVGLEPESPLLAGSVVTKDTTIETAGQQVETKSFNETQFNQNWE